MKNEIKEGHVNVKNGLVSIDTNVWMRPKTACDKLKEMGLSVSHSLMNYWKNEGKIDSIVIEELDNLTLVNINTIPEEMRVSVKLHK